MARHPAKVPFPCKYPGQNHRRLPWKTSRCSLSFDEIDERRNPRPREQEFDRVFASAISRRGFPGVLAFGSGAAAMGLGTLMGSASAHAQTAIRFAFAPFAMTTDFSVHVPEGNACKPVARWGDALFADAPAFNPEKGATAAG